MSGWQENDERRELWADYIDRREDSARDKLIEAYKGFARVMAARLYAQRQIDEIEFEEYLHYAFVGLLESIDRFDPQICTNFQSYAGIRITGAILSGIETNCELQQQITFKSRLKKQRLQVLQDHPSGKAAAPSIFEKLAEITIGLAIGYMLEDSGMFESDGEKQVQNGGYERVEFLQLREILRCLVQLLPNQQKKVVTYHYYYGYAFEKIGDELDISKGRVSQLHRQALNRLRDLYDQHAGVDRSV